MATILRPPLVSDRQPKRPIAPVDYFSRPLTLGINPNAAIAQLSDSAPQRTRRVHLDVYPNLLGTTLAPGAPATLDLPLRSGRVCESAPRKRWQPDSLQSQGLIVYDGPDAAVAQLSDSAPRARRSLCVEQASNLLSNTLGQSSPALPALAIRLDGSAPRRLPSLSSDPQPSRLVLGDITMPLMADRADASAPAAAAKRPAYGFDPPNLLGTTLQALDTLALPLSADRLDASAPAIKYQVRTEALSRPLTLGINPNAAVLQQSDSAPPPKRAAYGFDPPNLLLQTLAEPFGLPLNAGRVDGSAPILKYQVRVESLYRPITLGINPNPLTVQLSESAPPPKKAAYAFDPPNLIASTLAEALDLPRLAVRIDWSAPPPKRSAYFDQVLNTVITAPQASVPITGSRVIRVKANNRRITVRRSF